MQKSFSFFLNFMFFYFETLSFILLQPSLEYLRIAFFLNILMGRQFIGLNLLKLFLSFFFNVATCQLENFPLKTRFFAGKL